MGGPVTDALLTIAQFAARVGVHRNTVKGWLSKGMPVLRVGRVVRIDLLQARAWLDAQSTTAARRTAPVAKALPWQERRPTFRGRK